MNFRISRRQKYIQALRNHFLFFGCWLKTPACYSKSVCKRVLTWLLKSKTFFRFIFISNSLYSYSLTFFSQAESGSRLLRTEIITTTEYLPYTFTYAQSSWYYNANVCIKKLICLCICLVIGSTSRSTLKGWHLPCLVCFLIVTRWPRMLQRHPHGSPPLY